MELTQTEAGRALLAALNEQSFGALRKKRREALELPTQEPVEDLLFAIARCPVAQSCLSGDTETECTRVVASQASDGMFHLPEPWSGDLAHAPLLFLASNPSVSHAEEYPTFDWSDDGIVDFFQNRFSRGRKPWIKDGAYTLLTDGNQNNSRGTKFLQAVRARAFELLERDPLPGSDYAVTEVVHCKSGDEEGVSEAMMTCNYRYLDRVLIQSGARVIVVLGAVARDALNCVLNVPGFENNTMYGPITIGGRERLFAFLSHPNARTSRTFATSWQPDEVEVLRSFLRSA